MERRLSSAPIRLLRSADRLQDTVAEVRGQPPAGGETGSSLIRPAFFMACAKSYSACIPSQPRGERLGQADCHLGADTVLAVDQIAEGQARHAQDRKSWASLRRQKKHGRCPAASAVTSSRKNTEV